MNQILSTENISNKGKYNKGSQKDIKTVIKFFAIILIIFGIFITASSSYALYKNNEKKEVPTTKPEIVLENKNEDQLILKVMHGQIIDNVIYYWNNEEENRINGNGGKYVEKTLDIPNGENTLHVIAKDINNMTQEVNKTYTKTAQSGNVNIEIKLSGNNISISFTSEEKISYIKYNWDDEEEKEVEVNDTQYKTEIEAIKGEHTLTVYAVDENGNETKEVKKIIGTTKPKIQISKGDDCFVITATDESGIDKVVIKRTSDNKSFTMKAKDNEKEYKCEFPLEEGENRIEITVYNINGENLMSFFQVLSYFVIYSFLGWILESIFRSFCEKKLINTGFLIGPICPIYGAGAIIMLLFMGQLKGKTIVLFFVSMLVLTVWEYVVGVFLEKVFKTKYWDYSDHKINFQGRICLTNSIFWGLLGVGFINYIHPYILSLINMVDVNIFKNIIYISITIIIIDTIISIIKVINIKPAWQKVKDLNNEIKDKLKEIKESSKLNKQKVPEEVNKTVVELEKRRNKITRKLYKYVYRLKNAFPAIDTKEITEILNKKITFKKNKTNEKGRK